MDEREPRMADTEDRLRRTMETIIDRIGDPDGVPDPVTIDTRHEGRSAGRAIQPAYEPVVRREATPQPPSARH